MACRVPWRVVAVAVAVIATGCFPARVNKTVTATDTATDASSVLDTTSVSDSASPTDAPSLKDALPSGDMSPPGDMPPPKDMSGDVVAQGLNCNQYCDWLKSCGKQAEASACLSACFTPDTDFIGIFCASKVSPSCDMTAFDSCVTATKQAVPGNVSSCSDLCDYFEACKRPEMEVSNCRTGCTVAPPPQEHLNCVDGIAPQCDFTKILDLCVP